jgi:hypothetical protein
MISFVLQQQVSSSILAMRMERLDLFLKEAILLKVGKIGKLL